MPTNTLKGTPHAYGFKAFGTINRAVTLAGVNSGRLPTPGLNLGLNWRIKIRVRRNAGSPAGYVTGYSTAANGDLFHILYGFVGDKYEFYCTQNATGSTVRMALSSVVPSAGFNDVEFVYAGTTTSGTLTGYLNGAVDATLTVANLAPTFLANAPLDLPSASGNPGMTGAVDSLLIVAGGVTLVDMNFNESAGNAVNLGSLGGEMAFADGGPRELA